MSGIYPLLLNYGYLSCLVCLQQYVWYPYIQTVLLLCSTSVNVFSLISPLSFLWFVLHIHKYNARSKSFHADCGFLPNLRQFELKSAPSLLKINQRHHCLEFGASCLELRSAPSLFIIEISAILI